MGTKLKRRVGQRLDRLPPLPAGEGRGEGERGATGENAPPCFHGSGVLSLKIEDAVESVSTRFRDGFATELAAPSPHSPANFIPNLIHSGIVTKPTAEVLITTRRAVAGSPP